MANIDQAFIDAYQDAHPVSIPLTAYPNTARAKQASQSVTDKPETKAAAPEALRRLSANSVDLRADEANPKLETAGPHFTTRLDTRSTGYVTTFPDGDYPTEAIATHAPEEADAEIVLPPLGKERKPLSTFAAPQPPATEFRPAYEVDGYRWPRMTQQLAEHAYELLQPLVAGLLELAESGRGLIGLAGAHSESGTTTITLTLARLLAAAGKQVAIVDANFRSGDLAAQLDVEFHLGWDRLLSGELPLAECAIKSIEDGMTLVPLSGATEMDLAQVTVIHSAVMAGILRYHHDLVLFDLGSADDSHQALLMEGLCRHCRLDSTLIVAPAEITSPRQTHQLSEMQAWLGGSCLGIIGNRA